MIAVRIEDLLINQIDLVAKSKHSNRSSIIREAIVRFLEDNEDLELALQAKKDMKHTRPIKEVRAELELDDSD